ncbi:MAG: hypothetical protein ACE37F_14535 [Nannocystaceae bacterium]|nr:hypothetical protein [bacterium]
MKGARPADRACQTLQFEVLEKPVSRQRSGQCRGWLLGLLVPASACFTITTVGDGTSGEGSESSSVGILDPTNSTASSTDGRPDASSTLAGSATWTGSADSATFLDSSAPTSSPPSCSLLPCSLIRQDCCHGYACKTSENWAGDWNYPVCTPLVDDPAGVGEPCTLEDSRLSGIDSCDAGLMCFHASPDTLEGECVELCEDHETFECSQDGMRCMTANDGALPLCLSACDPLLEDCAEGFGCYEIPEADDFGCVLIESDVAPCPPSHIFVGNPVYGLGCTPKETCCVPVCDALEVDPCEPGSECYPLEWFEQHDVAACLTMPP